MEQPVALYSLRARSKLLAGFGLILLSRILFGKLNFAGWIGGKRLPEGRPHLFKDKFDEADTGTRDAFKEEWKKRCAKYGRK